MLKTIRTTSRRLNKGKLDLLKKIDEEVKSLKNQMSLFCHDHIFELISNPKFDGNYKLFKSEFLSAWEREKIFGRIILCYKIAFDAKIKNLDLKVQKEIKIEKYQKDSKHHKKGDLKSFKVIKEWTLLGKLVKYLVFCNENVKLPDELQSLYDYYKSKGFEDRIKNLVENIKTRLKNKIKLIHFNTGSYQKLHNGSMNKNGVQPICSEFIYDETNSLHKYWFKYKIQKKYIYIPIDVNEKYFNPMNIRKAAYQIKVFNNRIDIFGTTEVDDPDFQDFQKCEGLDLNVKHNFCVLSNGKEFDYDRRYLKDFCDELKKLDKIGLQNINEGQRKHLEKLVKRNEAYFKNLIHDIIQYLVENNITDVVMEDLGSFGKSFLKDDELGIKFSRLVRLLRLSNISTWMKEQAEKKGIRIHLTSPCYSSQQCPECGHIDRNNRKIQENFECVQCHHSNNADLNASINLRNRFTSDVLKENLHDQDQFGRLIPKKLRKETIKRILLGCG